MIGTVIIAIIYQIGFPFGFTNDERVSLRPGVVENADATTILGIMENIAETKTNAGIDPSAEFVMKYNDATIVIKRKLTENAIQNVLRLPSLGLVLASFDTMIHAKAGPNTATPMNSSLSISSGNNSVGIEKVHIIAQASTK